MEPDTECNSSAEINERSEHVLDAVMMKLPDPCFLKMLQTWSKVSFSQKGDT
jgi:hypothetical protein